MYYCMLTDFISSIIRNKLRNDDLGCIWNYHSITDFVIW